ncbi:MAG: hypothetical protein KGS61_03080 [Verrucomicrobia bacterium]|nr:hypothetical protein [Verrucomicrobiota bacterium]
MNTACFVNRCKQKCFLEGMAHPAGFEPAASSSQPTETKSNPSSAQPQCAQIRAQISDRVEPDLSKVVEAWAKLGAPLKTAILAIIGSATKAPEDGK